MAGAHILIIDSMPVVERGNGIQTIPLVTKEIGAKHITTGLTRFPAGAKVPLHSHNCDEQVTTLEGEAEAGVDGQRHHLHPFDTTLVPGISLIDLSMSGHRTSRLCGFIRAAT